MKTLERILVPASLALALLGPAFSARSPAAENPSQKPLVLQIATRGSEMAFDKTVLEAKAGQAIQLTFTNKADPSSSLQHTWVLVKPGTQDQVAADAVKAGKAKGYVPDSPDVLAHTRLLNPGESQTLRFRAPATPGDYPYICTFPGHAAALKGTLKVSG